VLLSLVAASAAEDNLPQVSLLEPTYHFEVTGASEPIEHIFQFRNNTTETLQAGGIKVTPPLQVPNISARVLPGELGILRCRVGEPQPVGDYEGYIEVDFKNPGVSNIIFEVTGKITPLIEAKPFPAFFVSTTRGQSKEASVQLINHDQEPLQITGIDCASKRFTLRLETNQPGQRYTLFLTLTGEGATGRAADRITLQTSNKKEPVFLIGANTYLRGRVHTFPDELDFGTMEIAQVKTNEAFRKTLTQVLMVYQDGGTNLQVTATTDLPFLVARSEPAPAGKQVQIEVELKPKDVHEGDFQGHLQLLTNDPEFPSLQLNISGHFR
jgi:hypothetical protein